MRGHASSTRFAQLAEARRAASCSARKVHPISTLRLRDPPAPRLGCAPGAPHPIGARPRLQPAPSPIPLGLAIPLRLSLGVAPPPARARAWAAPNSFVPPSNQSLARDLLWPRLQTRPCPVPGLARSGPTPGPPRRRCAGPWKAPPADARNC